ncbi:hypothetical protein FJY71_05230 [candidate division WOR-3 bacterium]|nr:hypothetical protein [candidate division WOR-3 bacterium]
MKHVPPAADPGLARALDRLEAKIDAALELVARLRRENRELAGRAEATERLRREAVRQLNTILDRIGALL